MTSMTDFTNTRREMKYSLYNALDYAKDLEEKFQAMSQLVETLTHANYKKDRKIQKLSQKLKKYKSDARYRDRHFPQEEELENEELEEDPQKEVIDLTQIPEEEEPPIIPQPPKIKVEKIAKKVKIEEPLVIVIEEEVAEEVVEEEVVETEVVEKIEEEVVEEEVAEEVVEEVEEIVTEEEETPETEIEEQEEEENIEPELEPDVISEPEENQPTEEPILEKEDDDNMELIIEDPEEQIVEETVEETAEETAEETVEEEEEELYEVVIGKTSYYVANEENGPIYEITADQEVGEEVGQYVNRKPVFQSKSSTAPEPQTETEEEAEEDEVELIQIKINGVNYAVEEENQIDGPIYSLGFDGDVDKEVGKYVKGKPTFYPTEAKTAAK
jgi:hypothetical protein